MSAPDHHWLVAAQPHLTEKDASCLDSVFSNRWKTLLSVDDLFFEIYSDVEAAGALNNTYFFFSSDHGLVPHVASCLLMSRQISLGVFKLIEQTDFSLGSA